MAKVDCTVDSDLCHEFNVMGYPTIILFSKDGKKHAFQGERVGFCSCSARACCCTKRRSSLIRLPCLHCGFAARLDFEPLTADRRCSRRLHLEQQGRQSMNLGSSVGHEGTGRAISPVKDFLLWFIKAPALNSSQPIPLRVRARVADV